ncbi:sugar transferase [bacterium]|nr:sugar transferase [bacterium]MBU1920763.1 sugar transferase [bacterium]
MPQITERSIWVRVLALTIDLLLTAIAFVTAFSLRTEIRAIYFFGSAQSVQDYYNILAIIIPIWWFLLNVQKVHLFNRATPLSREFGIAARTVVIGTVMLFAVTYVIRFDMPPRSTIALFVLLNIFLLCVNRVFIRNLKEFLRREGGYTKKALIIGAGDKAKRFLEQASEHGDWAFDVVGFIDFDKARIGKKILGSEIIGTPDDLLDILHRFPVQEVVFAVSTSKISDCTDMLALCEQEGVRAVILSDFFSSLVAHVQTEIQYDQPVLIYSSVRHKEWQLLVKRLFDLLFSGIMLLLLTPLLIVIAILIKLHDGGPVFYRWKVVGQNKENFTGYKFRTMVVDADKKKEELMAMNEMAGVAFKMKHDPRITPVGRLLRKFSLDELPQLWSVFKGDMSIVGPRPPLESELPKFDSWHRRKLSVKPGLTCLWQISGRSTITDFDEWIRLDLAYIDNWTLWLDFKILAKTIPAVLLGRGAQ